MYASYGILQRRTSTRLAADKRSFRNPGNGNGMPFNEGDRRPGADPPKKESGTIGTIPELNSRARSVNAGNGYRRDLLKKKMRTVNWPTWRQSAVVARACSIQMT